MRLHEKYNLTPFAVDLGFCTDAEGQDMAVALLKATFRFTAAGQVSRAEPHGMLPVVLSDQHWGDPGTSSLRHPGEVVPSRNGTDVAVHGHAYGRGRSEVEAGFRLGALEKLVSVFGTRTWAGTWPAPIVGPAPMDKVALRYENAFGGTYQDPERGPVGYLENPVGRGFTATAGAGLQLPSIEHRHKRLRSPGDRPLPAGLGFIPPGWKQRASFAGTFDEAWKKERRPLLPVDLDERFWNAVPQDQVLRPGLRGGEPLTLRNLHPASETVVLTVPPLAFTAQFVVKERAEEVEMVADTLLVQPDQERFAVTYRACLPVEGEIRCLKSVVFRDVRAGHPVVRVSR